MSNIIEEKIKHCDKCQCDTKHERNGSKSSGFMIFIHIVLTLMTWGVYLIPMAIYMLVSKASSDSWKCASCASNRDE